MPKKVKPHIKRRRKCDPEMCENCQYIGDGDFICDRYIDDPDAVMVISDWEPTENYMQCHSREHN